MKTARTKKTRLLIKTKYRLERFARTHIDEAFSKEDIAKETKKLDAVIKKRLMGMLTKQFPAAEMAILEKYQLTRPYYRAEWAYFSDDAGATKYGSFDFNEDGRRHWGRDVDTSKMTEGVDYIIGPDGSRQGPLAVTKKTFELLEQRDRVIGEFTKRRHECFSEYLGLIKAAKYAEDVMEVWPNSKVILEPYIIERNGSNSLPTTLSEASIANIKRTNIGASQKEEANQ